MVGGASSQPLCSATVWRRFDAQPLHHTSFFAIRAPAVVHQRCKKEGVKKMHMVNSSM